MGKEILKRDKEIPVKFKPRARLLLQLGDQLIKNESIALVELVKNSYDADAKIVDIYMEKVDDLQSGVIIIEDDGFGMDAKTVEDVWMEPGSDFKTEKFRNRELSPKYKRLPIGEKGIGRFGVHKLGNQIEMTTKKVNEKEVYVKIDWTLFNNYRYLEQVPISITVRENPKLFTKGKTGTSITISNLRKEWSRGVARNVKRTITALVSPFKSDDSFRAVFDVADKPGWFEDILEWEDIREYALFNFKVVIKGDSIKELTYSFTPWATMPKLTPRKVHYKQNKIITKNLTTSEDKLIKLFSELSDNDGNKVTLSHHDIGEVVFEGYIFDRDAFVMKLGVSDKLGFRGYLDGNSGIRVFRDGLRVYDYGEPENDWLGLDYRRFLNPTKCVSNNLILGAIYLKREDSESLIEKTNREGFVENPAYDSFKNSILHSLNIIETLRFSDKQKLREIYGPTPKSEPVLHLLGDAKAYVDKNVKDLVVKKEITKYLIKIEDDYKRINENLLKAAGAGLSMSVVIHEVEKIILELVKALKVENASLKLMNLVKHLSNLIDGYSEIIRKSNQTNEDLKEVIDQALTNIELRLASHKIEVIREFKKYKAKTKIKISRSLLIGSLMNIFDNSIYWLDKSGTRRKKIHVSLSEEDNYINIIISDNGTGFLLPTEEITEPFVSAKPGGIGLGLHIASEIMLAQKGKLFFPDWGEFEIPNDFKNGATIVFAFKK